MTRTVPHRLSVSLLTLGDPDTLTGGYLYHRRLAELASRHDARLIFASFPAKPFPFPVLYGPRLLRALSAQRPDVVVLDSIAAAFLAPWTAGVRVPMVVMAHQPPGGIDHGPARRYVQAVLDRAAYRRVERVLVASQLLAGQFGGHGLAGRLLVVPPGRDVASAPAGQKQDLRGDARAALLCVGNWVARKGIVQALDAVARLPAGLVRLHLAGDDRPEPEYAARVRRRLAGGDVADRVEYHGRLSREEVAALYRDADVFVLPSLREPYGTVYGEAMAAGLPVVGWRAGNLPYLAGHEREGLLAEPGDLAGLVSALRRLAEDEELRTRLGSAARQRAATFPTWEQTAELFFTAVREAAGRPDANPGVRTRSERSPARNSPPGPASSPGQQAESPGPGRPPGVLRRWPPAYSAAPRTWDDVTVGYWLTKYTLGITLKILFRSRAWGTKNVPRRGPVILASNHLSFSDHFFGPFPVPRKVTYLAKSEYFTGRGLKGLISRAFFTGVGQIPLDRAGGPASEQAIRTGLQVLADGNVLGIYPEGTRSPDGRLYRGKTGVARLAIESGAPVVPCAMIDTFQFQPPGKIWPDPRFRPGVRFGEPLDFSRYRGLEADAKLLRTITDEIMQAIAKLSGQEYVDVDARLAKAELAADKDKTTP